MLSDNGVYSWRWKDKERHADCGDFRSYHCYSRIAVARDGKLFDTFWAGNGTRLERGDIVARFLGSLDEMREIGRWETDVMNRVNDVLAEEIISED